MAQTIKLRRSATAGAAPTTSQLELGEVAINTYDGKMYIKKSVGGTDSIVEIGSGLTPADAILEEYLYTATASQTAFSGNDDNSDFLSYAAGALQVFLNGILLDPETDYTATNGALITLTEAAALNDYLQIFAFKKKIGDSSITINTFTGNNSTTAFTLSLDPGDENNTRVFIDGVYQSKSNYAVSGTTLTFSSAPPSGTGIEVEIGNRAVSLDTASGLDLLDNVKLRLGTSQDLEIYHDASDSLINDNGTGSLKLQTGGSTKLEITSSGVDVTGNVAVSGTVDGVDIAARDSVLTSTTTTAGAALPRTGGAMTGAITTNSTFDGRDVATDGAKLDGIEAGATADQTQSEINALGITATGLSGTPAISVANITTTGELRGPASLVIDPAAVGDNTGTVVIKGNLQVDGATTTINSTTLTVDDLNLTLASGAANGTAANGAGITVDGASATITYASSTDSWDFNKKVKFNTVQAHGSNNFTIDSPAEIHLDSHSGFTRLRSQGGDIALLQLSNNDLTIRSMVSDRDIIFQGYDGSTNITALFLDMSNAGTAVFGGQIITPASGVIETASSAGTLTISGGATNKGGQIVLSGGNNTGTGGSGIKFYAQASTASPTERMRIDSSGRVGIKTTPSAWTTDYAVLDLNTGGSIYGTTSGVTTSSNLYFNGSSWLAKTTGLGTLYAQHTGKHIWYSNASVSAGSAAALSTKMTLDASGNLGIGESNPNASRLHVRDNKGSAGDVWTQVGAGNNMGITLQNETTVDNANSVIYFKNDTDYVASIGARYVSHSTNETEIRFGTTNSSGTTTEKMYLRGGGELQTLAPVMVGGSVGLAASQISGTPADQNYAEVGPGYINLARDDTANASQIRFAKNGSIHSYLETRTTGLGFVTDVGNFAFEGGNVGIGTAAPAARLHISGNSDVSDEDCMLIIDDVDGSAGSRIPAIMFRSNTGGTVTNQARIRGTDTHGIVMSGSSALSDDLVVQAGKVGIGHNSPSAPLDIQTSHSSTDVTAANSNSTLRIGNSAAGNGIYNAIKFSANQQDMYIMSFNNNQQADRRLGFFLGSVAGDATTDERLSIRGNGNVGIGEDTPLAKLHVVGGRTSGTTYNTIIAAGGVNSTDGSGARIILTGCENDPLARGTVIEGISTGTGNSHRLNFKTNNGSSVPTTRMTIGHTGNVGIGTTNPQRKLVVYQGDSGQAQIQFQNVTTGSVAGDGFGVGLDSSEKGFIWNYEGNDTYIGGAGGTSITIQNGGNVGIGIQSPFSRLQSGGHTFSGGHGMYADARVGISNHGSLTGMMLASTYNDAAHPEYGLVFVQGPTTSSYNVWSISPDGPAKGNGLNFHYQAQSTNIHSPSNAKVTFKGDGKVGIGTTSPDAKLSVTSTTINSEDILYLKSGADNVNDYLGIAWELGVGGNGPHSAIRSFAGPSGSDARLGFLTTSNGGTTLTEGLSIAHDGNVGIGTSSPYGLTHWQKSSTVNLVATNTGADGQADTTVMSLIGQARGYSNNLSKLASIDFKTDPTTWYYGAITFNVANLDGTDTSRTPLEAMRINRLGNVGIGTDTPGYKLEISDDTDSTVNLLRLRNADSTYSQTWDFQLNTSKHLEITGASGSGGIVLNPGTTGTTVNSGLYVVSNNSSNAFTVKTNHSGNPTALQIGGAGAINGVASSNQSFTVLNVGRDTGSLNSAYFHGNVKVGGHITPATDNTHDLGTATKRWRNIYTGDLHLSNESQKKGNDVDGTKGNWTVQEGEENLYLINNKTGKKYKFALEEIE